MMTSKEKYRELCKTEPSIPLFSRAWWLDATAGENAWDVVVSEKNGKIHASMPFLVARKYGFRVISQPKLTQTLGPWIRPVEMKNGSRLALEKDLMSELIAGLPHFDYFSQAWHYSRTNWLPFYWKGFQQTTRYTYVLPCQNVDAVWAQFQENIRGDIKKATGRHGLEVRTDLDLASFLALNKMTFERQGISLPYSEDYVRKLDTACASNDCRKTFIAVDREGRAHAGVYIVWDENSAYYLMGGGDPTLRNSGATSLCMWEAIKFAATVTKSFDFEGSMLEPVERFFRAFGASQQPYYVVTKVPSKVLSARQALVSLMRGQ